MDYREYDSGGQSVMVGDVVEICGKKGKPELNGCQGLLEAFVVKTRRFGVRVQPANLRIVRRINGGNGKRRGLMRRERQRRTSTSRCMNSGAKTTGVEFDEIDFLVEFNMHVQEFNRACQAMSAMCERSGEASLYGKLCGQRSLKSKQTHAHSDTHRHTQTHKHKDIAVHTPCSTKCCYILHSSFHRLRSSMGEDGERWNQSRWSTWPRHQLQYDHMVAKWACTVCWKTESAQRASRML